MRVGMEGGVVVLWGLVAGRRGESRVGCEGWSGWLWVCRVCGWWIVGWGGRGWLWVSRIGVELVVSMVCNAIQVMGGALSWVPVS